MFSLRVRGSELPEKFQFCSLIIVNTGKLEFGSDSQKETPQSNKTNVNEKGLFAEILPNIYYSRT